MIAVIGCAKETVRVKMRMPREGSSHIGLGESGFGSKASWDEEDDDIKAKNSGSAFNIAVNLASWGYDTEFISAVGDDTVGMAVKAELESAGVGTDGLKIFPGSTAIDVEFFNILGDIEMFRSNRAVLKNITPELLKEKEEILESAEIIVIDGTIPQESIEYMSKKYGNDSGKKLFFDPSDLPGSIKAAEAVSGFYCVMPGRMEAEAMTGETVLSEEQLSEAGEFFSKAGVHKVIITIKGGGLYYKEGSCEGILRPERMITFGSTSGAGDIVSAAVAAGTVDGESIDKIAGRAMDKAAEFLADVKDEKLS